jgi:hypothetical protein
MAQSFTQWREGQPSGMGVELHMGPEPFFRDGLDAMRSMWRRTPDATYPDGYLGTITNRREDRVMRAVTRQNQRSYQRGVHKGERIDQSDYFWPPEFNPQTGIMLQAAGMKYSPAGVEPIVLTNDGKVGPRGIPRGVEAVNDGIDLARAAQLKRLAPGWR